MSRAWAAIESLTPDEVGRIMHESWTTTKRAQGFHHPTEHQGFDPFERCEKCDIDLVPWERLHEPFREIKRHAFDAVLKVLRERAGPLSTDGDYGTDPTWPGPGSGQDD